MINSNYFKDVLVLAPHTDDGELGCGGLISKFVENNVKVTYVAFSTAEKSVPQGFPKDILKTEVRRATSLLGIKSDFLHILNYEVRKFNYSRQEILENLIEIRKDNKYDLVLMPCLQDMHQDHAVIAQEGLRAFKGTTILSYELIWNNLNFNAQCFIKLEARHIQKKIDSLKEYRSQESRDYLSQDFIYSMAKARGVQVGYKFAEAFEVVRLFINH